MTRIFVLISLAIFFSFSGPSIAQEADLKVSTIVYPPMAIDNKRGIVIELAREAFSRVGVRVEFRSFPWARALASAVKGETSAITPVFKTKERERLLYFPETPLYDLQMVLFMRKEAQDPFDGSVKSLNGRKIAFVDGTQLTREFDQAKIDGRLDAKFALTLEQQMKMVDAQRVDFAVAERMAGLQMLESLGLAQNFKMAKVPIVSRGVFVGLSRQTSSAEEAEQLNLAIRSMYADGSYQRVLKKYMSIN